MTSPKLLLWTSVTTSHVTCLLVKQDVDICVQRQRHESSKGSSPTEENVTVTFPPKKRRRKSVTVDDVKDVTSADGKVTLADTNKVSNDYIVSF